MELKVVRYQNYGCQMLGGEDDDVLRDKFYFSYFEFNNGKIIELTLIEYYKKYKVDMFYNLLPWVMSGSLIGTDMNFGSTWYELHNGQVISYEFGQDWSKWFQSCPMHDDIKESRCPSLDEEKCAKEFFVKNLSSKKDISTDVIYI